MGGIFCKIKGLHSREKGSVQTVSNKETYRKMQSTKEVWMRRKR